MAAKSPFEGQNVTDTGLVLKKINFTHFLTPQAQHSENARAAAKQGDKFEAKKKYTHVKSNWTRELLQYRDALQEKKVKQEEQDKASAQMRRGAQIRLRKKADAMQVPMIEPPPEVLAMATKFRPELGGGGSPPTQRKATATSLSTELSERAQSCPPPATSGSLSPSFAKPISWCQTNKSLTALYPEATQKYSQLLLLAGDIEQAKRIERKREAELDQMEERLKTEDANAQIAQQKVKAAHMARQAAIQASVDRASKKADKALQKRNEQIELRQDQIKAELKRLQKDNAHAAQVRREKSEAQIQRRQDIARIQEETYQRKEQKDAEFEAKLDQQKEIWDQKDHNIQSRREAIQQSQKEWLAEVHRDWQAACEGALAEQEKRFKMRTQNIEAEAAQRELHVQQVQKQQAEAREALRKKMHDRADKVKERVEALDNDHGALTQEKKNKRQMDRADAAALKAQEARKQYQHELTLAQAQRHAMAQSNREREDYEFRNKWEKKVEADDARQQAHTETIRQQSKRSETVNHKVKVLMQEQQRIEDLAIELEANEAERIAAVKVREKEKEDRALAIEMKKEARLKAGKERIQNEAMERQRNIEKQLKENEKRIEQARITKNMRREELVQKNTKEALDMLAALAQEDEDNFQAALEATRREQLKQQKRDAQHQDWINSKASRAVEFRRPHQPVDPAIRINAIEETREEKQKAFERLKIEQAAERKRVQDLAEKRREKAEESYSERLDNQIAKQERDQKATANKLKKAANSRNKLLADISDREANHDEVRKQKRMNAIAAKEQIRQQIESKVNAPANCEKLAEKWFEDVVLP